MTKQFNEGAPLGMDEVQLDCGALPLSQLAGWKAAAGGDCLLSSTGEVQPNREVGCSGRCIPFLGKCGWSARLTGIFEHHTLQLWCEALQGILGAG